MSESCTIFCRSAIPDVRAIQSRLAILGDIKTEIDGDVSINCVTPSGSVRFSLKKFSERADPFCKLVARSIVFIERRAEENPQGVAKVTAHLEATEAALGIVAEPSFDQIDHLQSAIRFLTVEYNGLIFNGEEMLDAAGHPIA